ncbi:MAG: SulP family inorganic anion transporter [Halanaerobiales bacterium]|nr:SulP family inorganic anion transporter [Halanaerobiales bacterium]
MNPKNLKDDFISGLTTATIALPQNMAYALILNINPIYGVYASIFSMLSASIFNVSNYLIVGPTNMMTVALYSTLRQYQGDNYLEIIFLTTFLIGLFQFILVSVNLSELVKYISYPVVVGLSHGAALLILMSQLENLTGINITGSNFILKFWSFLNNIDQLHYVNLLIGISTVLLIYLFSKVKINLPEYLLAIIIMTSITSLSGLNEVIPLIREIPNRIVDFNIINFEWGMITEIYSKAFSIALLGLIQTMAVLKAVALRTKEDIDFRKEFRSQGITNMIIPFFSSFAISASFAKSYANLTAGAKTKISQFFSAISIIIFILFFRSLLSYVPVAVLSGLVIAAALKIIDIKEIKNNLKTTRGDALVLISTFLAVIILPHLDQAIYFGVIVSVVVVLKISNEADIDFFYYSKKKEEEEYILHDADIKRKSDDKSRQNRARVIDLKGAVHFSAAEDLKKQLDDFFEEEADFIIRMRNVKRLDITIIKVLEEFINKVYENNGEVLLTGVNQHILNELQQIGLAHKIGNENIYLPQKELLASTNKAITSSEKNKNNK